MMQPPTEEYRTEEYRKLPAKQKTIDQARGLAGGLPRLANIEKFESDFVYSAFVEIREVWQGRSDDYPMVFDLRNWPKVGGPRYLTWGQLKLRTGITQEFIDKHLQVEADVPLVCFLRPHPLQAKIYHVREVGQSR